MAYSRSRRSTTYGEFWPGYVDVLSTLLLVVTFLMSVFMVSQFYVSQEAAGKDTALRRLTRQIAEITNLLSLEKGRQRATDRCCRPQRRQGRAHLRARQGACRQVRHVE
jgi:chemotaxis protein MotB